MRVLTIKPVALQGVQADGGLHRVVKVREAYERPLTLSLLPRYKPQGSIALEGPEHVSHLSLCGVSWQALHVDSLGRVGRHREKTLLTSGRGGRHVRHLLPE